MNVATFIDYRIRKRIIAYEDSTTDQYAPAREKMKECVNKMMKSLAREAARSGKDKDYYGLVLYFDDYSNIEVVDHWRPKSMVFFKKSYNHYQVSTQALNGTAHSVLVNIREKGLGNGFAPGRISRLSGRQLLPGDREVYPLLPPVPYPQEEP